MIFDTFSSDNFHVTKFPAIIAMLLFTAIDRIPFGFDHW